MQIWVPTNPPGAERLPPGIVESESDFYLRRLWGLPSEVCICYHNVTVKTMLVFIVLLYIKSLNPATFSFSFRNDSIEMVKYEQFRNCIEMLKRGTL